MTAPTLTWKQIVALKPCAAQRDAASAKLRASYPDIDTRAFTLADAATAGVHFECLIWIASRASEVDLDCARRIRLFSADCAARVAHIANDPRSTAAIVAARQFARGEIGVEQLNAARVAARAAAWGARAVSAAARVAARAAAWDAAWAARDAASDAARDAASDASDAASDAARAAEQKWQAERLIEWFSDKEPSDWPIKETEQ